MSHRRFWRRNLTPSLVTCGRSAASFTLFSAVRCLSITTRRRRQSGWPARTELFLTLPSGRTTRRSAKTWSSAFWSRNLRSVLRLTRRWITPGSARLRPSMTTRSAVSPLRQRSARNVKCAVVAPDMQVSATARLPACNRLTPHNNKNSTGVKRRQRQTSKIEPVCVTTSRTAEGYRSKKPETAPSQCIKGKIKIKQVHMMAVHGKGNWSKAWLQPFKWAKY